MCLLLHLHEMSSFYLFLKLSFNSPKICFTEDIKINLDNIPFVSLKRRLLSLSRLINQALPHPLHWTLLITVGVFFFSSLPDFLPLFVFLSQKAKPRTIFQLSQDVQRHWQILLYTITLWFISVLSAFLFTCALLNDSGKTYSSLYIFFQGYLFLSLFLLSRFSGRLKKKNDSESFETVIHSTNIYWVPTTWLLLFWSLGIQLRPLMVLIAAAQAMVMNFTLTLNTEQNQRSREWRAER